MDQKSSYTHKIKITEGREVVWQSDRSEALKALFILGHLRNLCLLMWED